MKTTTKKIMMMAVMLALGSSLFILQVSAQKYALIKTYERMSAERNINNAVRRFSVLGNLVVIALILLVYFLYIKIMYPNVYRSLRHMTFLFSFVLVIVLVVYVIAHFRCPLL